MRYLIDGHNLIAYLPDIQLDDPEDEVKLVYKLRGFAARSKKSLKMTVIFDGGIPGGVEQNLSNSVLTARFAAAESSTGDSVLRSLIQKASDPAQFTLVTSDQELIDLARVRNMPVMTAAEFIGFMNSTAKPHPPEAKKNNPKLSKSEVEEWLDIFTKKKD